MYNKKRLMKIERRRYITITANKSLSYQGIDKKKCTLSHNSIDDVGSFSYAKHLRPLFCNLIWLIKLEFKKKANSIVSQFLPSHRHHLICQMKYESENIWFELKLLL